MKKRIIKTFILILTITSLFTACSKKDDTPKVVEKIDNKEKSLLKAEKLIEEKDLLAAEKAYENLLEIFDDEPIVYKNLAYIKNYYGNKEQAADILVKAVVNINGEIDKESLYLDLIEIIDSDLYQEKYKKFFLDINKSDMTDRIFNNLLVLNKDNQELISELKDNYKPKNDEFLIFLENKINNYQDEELERKTIDNINKDTDILLLEELIRDRVLIGYAYYEDLVLAKEVIEKIEENNINIDNSFLKGLKYYFDNHDGEKIEKIYFEDLDFDLRKDVVLVTSKEKYLYEDGGSISIILNEGKTSVIEISESKAVEIELVFSDLDKDAYKEILSVESQGGSENKKDLNIYSINEKEYNIDSILKEDINISIENGFVLDIIDYDKNEYARLTFPKNMIDAGIETNLYREDGKLLKEDVINLIYDIDISFNENLKKDIINMISHVYLDLDQMTYVGSVNKEYEIKEETLEYKGFIFKDIDSSVIPNQDLSKRQIDEIEDNEDDIKTENNLTKEEQDKVIDNLKNLRKYFGKTSDEIINIMGKPDKDLLEDLHLGYAKYFVYIDEDNQEKYFTFNTDSDKLIALDGDQIFIYGVDKYPTFKDITDMFGQDYIKDDEFLSGVSDLDGNSLDEIVYITDDGLMLSFVETAYNTKEYRLSLFLNSEE